MNKKILYAFVLLIFSISFFSGCRMIANTPQLMPNPNIDSLLIEYNEQQIEITNKQTIADLYEKYGQITTNTRPGSSTEQMQSYGQLVLKVTTRTESGIFSFRIVSRTFGNSTSYYFEKTKTNGSVIMISAATVQDVNYLTSLFEED